MQWIFENGGVYPSPIPLANKKTKVLAGKLKQYSHRLDAVFVETLILLTEDGARAKLNDDQAGRVVHLKDAFDRLSDPKYLPVSTVNVAALAAVAVADGQISCAPLAVLGAVGIQAAEPREVVHGRARSGILQGREWLRPPRLRNRFIEPRQRCAATRQLPVIALFALGP
jgi:hypothetical protein